MSPTPFEQPSGLYGFRRTPRALDLVRDARALERLLGVLLWAAFFAVLVGRGV